MKMATATSDDEPRIWEPNEVLWKGESMQGLNPRWLLNYYDKYMDKRTNDASFVTRIPEGHFFIGMGERGHGNINSPNA